MTVEKGIAPQRESGLRSEWTENDVQRKHFHCNFCNSTNETELSFTSRYLLQQHIMMNHPTVCIGCDTEVNTLEELFHHLVAADHDGISFCRSCHKIFISSDDLKLHDCVKTEVKEEPTSSSDDEEGREDGENNSTSESAGSFLCEVCDRSNKQSYAVFKERDHLVVHTYRNHPTTCIGCFETFNTMSDLMNHLKHVAHNLPVCRDCWKQFPDECYLSRHNCTGQSLEECNNQTGIESTSSNTMELNGCEADKDNESSDNEESVDRCQDQNIEKEDDTDGDDDYEPSDENESCSSDNSDLKGPRRLKTIYKCTACCRTFRSKSNFECHLKKEYESEKRFNCKICNLQVLHKSGLLKHLKRFHPNVKVTSEDLNPVSVLNEDGVLKFHLRAVNERRNISDQFNAGQMSLNTAVIKGCTTEADNSVCSSGQKLNSEATHSEPSADDQDHSKATVKCEPVSEEEAGDGSMNSTSESEAELMSDEETDDDKDRPSKGDLSCIHCGCDGFHDQRALRYHTAMKHSSVCIICFEGFDNDESLRCHQKSMKHDVWSCEACNMHFIRRSLYRHHIARNHSEKCPFRCRDCNEFGSFSKATFIYHRQTVHGEATKTTDEDRKITRNWKISSRVCDICLKFFMTSYSYFLHMYNEHNEAGQTHIYKCELCQFGFGRGHIMEMHLKEFHSDDTEYLNSVQQFLESTLKEPTKCEVCGKETDGLSSHILRYHRYLRPHKCPVCGLGFSDEGDIKVHLHQDHNGPIYLVCPICDFTSKKMNTLIGHMKKRHEYKAMPVSYCFKHKRGFHSRDILNQHLDNLHPEINHGKKALVSNCPCPQCGKLIKVCNLKIHILKVHTKREASFKCDQCGKAYKDLSSLSIHKIIHTDTYRCTTCGKSFGLKHGLERHQVVHTGEKPFKCEICGLAVSQRSALQRHVKVVHPNGKLKKGYKPFPRKSRTPKSEAAKSSVNSDIEKKKKKDIEVEENHSMDDTPQTSRKRNLRKRIIQYEEEHFSPEKKTKKRGRPRKRRKLDLDDEWQASDDE